MRDVVYEMDVTLEELCKGGAKRVRISSEGRQGQRVAKDVDIDIRKGMRSVRQGFIRS